MRTGRPIHRRTPGDPRGFALGLAQELSPQLGRFWFYEGETLGYRVARFWWPEDDLLMVLAANSQPPADQDKLGALAVQLYTILEQHRHDPLLPMTVDPRPRRTTGSAFPVAAGGRSARWSPRMPDRRRRGEGLGRFSGVVGAAQP